MLFVCMMINKALEKKWLSNRVFKYFGGFYHGVKKIFRKLKNDFSKVPPWTNLLKHKIL